MSIRQIRLNTLEQIKSRVREFQHKNIHIVLTDRTAVLGILKEIDAEGILLENKRLKKNRYAFAEISELYFDQRI
jgi:hypothetical protein